MQFFLDIKTKDAVSFLDIKARDAESYAKDTHVL